MMMLTIDEKNNNLNSKFLLDFDHAKLNKC
jgi:hypothetical protein